MTKVIKIGEEVQKVEEPKYVQFNKVLQIPSNSIPYIGVAVTTPKDWKYIELICKDYSPGVDLMFAYDHPEERSHGILFLGAFNDGVVYKG